MVFGHPCKGATDPSGVLVVLLERGFSSEIPAVKQQLQAKFWDEWHKAVNTFFVSGFCGVISSPGSNSDPVFLDSVPAKRSMTLPEN